MSFKYKILLITTPLIFILDQLTKMLIRSSLELGESISVISGYFDIVHVVNRGAAFGMFSSSSPAFRVPFFYIVSAIAVVILVVVFIKLSARERLLVFVFSLILGGIAGNLTDRLMFGEVTDFLSLHIQDKVAHVTMLGHLFDFKLEWPAFNVADSAITVSMILLVWSMIRKDPKTKIQNTKQNQNPRSKTSL